MCFSSGSSSSSNAQNQTTVNVSTAYNVDTTGVQNAINALAQSSQIGQLAVASAVGSVGAANERAAQINAQALQSLNSNSKIEITVAIIGLVAALIYAHVIKFKGISR